MKININETLQKFLEEKGTKHLVLQVKLCNSWAGVYKDVTASFAEGNEQWLVEDGYVAGESQIGKVYYRPDEIRFGENPEIHMIKSLFGQRVMMKHIKAIN